MDTRLRSAWRSDWYYSFATYIRYQFGAGLPTTDRYISEVGRGARCTYQRGSSCYPLWRTGKCQGSSYSRCTAYLDGATESDWSFRFIVRISVRRTHQAFTGRGMALPAEDSGSGTENGGLCPDVQYGKACDADRYTCPPSQ